MGKSIKISRIRLGNEYFNVITGNKADLMATSFALLNVSSKDNCPVMVVDKSNNNLLVANDDFIKNPVRMDKCKICEGVKSCPMTKVLKAHKKNWERLSGMVSKKEKPRKTPSKYVKVPIE